MNFKKFFTGLVTTATLGLGILIAPSAFAQEAPATKLCRDATTQEWLYYNELNHAGKTVGYDCNGVDANGLDKAGVQVITGPADNPNQPNGSCKDTTGAWLYGADGFDCNGFDRDGKKKELIVQPPADQTPKDNCRDTTGAWKYDSSGFDCNGFDRDGKQKDQVVLPPVKPTKPIKKCDTPSVPWEYTKQVVNGKEYQLDKNGYSPEGYSPSTDTWYKADATVTKPCEKAPVNKNVIKKIIKKTRIEWKNGKPVAPKMPVAPKS